MGLFRKSASDYGASGNNQLMHRNHIVEGLCYWLSLRLTEEEVKKDAKELCFEEINNEALDKIIYRELFILNMWIIVDTCHAFFGGDERNEILNAFHLSVYNHFQFEENISYDEWVTSVCSQYGEYRKEVGAENSSTPIWFMKDNQSPWSFLIARTFNKGVFGEIKDASAVQILQVIKNMSMRIFSLTSYLGELRKKSDTE